MTYLVNALIKRCEVVFVETELCFEHYQRLRLVNSDQVWNPDWWREMGFRNLYNMIELQSGFSKYLEIDNTRGFIGRKNRRFMF